MVACLSLWTTGFKLSPLAHALDKFFNVAIGVLQRADTSTAYHRSSARTNG